MKSALKKPSSKLTEEALEQHSIMSLEEKLENWKKKGDIEAPLALDHKEQKRLSSKFLHALKGAPSEVSSHYSKLSELQPGQKNKQKQLLVRSWIMDRGWGETFSTHSKSLTFNLENKQIEKPMTMKELELKYTDDEIADLLESGGISEVKHAKSSRVKLYVDHGLWERSKSLVKTRATSSKATKHETDENALEGFDHGFTGFSMDLDKAEDFFSC